MGEQLALNEYWKSIYITALPPPAYLPGSLPGPLPSFEVRDLILGGVSRLDAFSVYLVRT